MIKDEALKMAIDFMETLTIDVGIKIWNEKHRKEAINACKKALEQPAQEPVAWMDSEGRFRLDFRTEIVRSIAVVNKEIPLYTHPHQWQGLTNEQSVELFICCLSADETLLLNNISSEQIIKFARAIEAKLKEKNHG